MLTFRFAHRDRRFRLERTFNAADLSDWVLVGRLQTAFPLPAAALRQQLGGSQPAPWTSFLFKSGQDERSKALATKSLPRRKPTGSTL